MTRYLSVVIVALFSLIVVGFGDVNVDTTFERYQKNGNKSVAEKASAQFLKKLGDTKKADGKPSKKARTLAYCSTPKGKEAKSARDFLALPKPEKAYGDVSTITQIIVCIPQDKEKVYLGAVVLGLDAKNVVIALAD